MVRLSVRVSFYPMILLISLAGANEICRRSFYIDEDIDLFGNYTDLITLTMGCSQPGFPSLSVTVEPRLRSQIEQRESLNGKVAFSIRCEMNGTVNYTNRSAGVKKSVPWISFFKFSSDLPLGQSCSVIGCFWDSYQFSETVEEQRRFAVKGSSCITNLNECAIDPEQCEQVCVDTIAAYECSCWSGYRLENNSRNCSDVDECSNGAHVCSHNCHNTEGSYTCSCPSGYNLLEDNITCLDINECLNEENPCDHQCNNTAGSFRCLCREGFKLSDDQHSCEDINECDPESGTNQCQHSCTNTIGSYSCSCDTGFSLSSDRHHCLGAGECENPQVCSQVCVNTTGDYFCQCHSGFQLSHDGHNCSAKAQLEDGVLVIYMPWAIPLAVASLLLLLALALYYSITRRRKHGHILETNQDLYEFYLTQEKIDCSYQPVDLSNGLPFDAESIHSEMTSFHSTSNTNEDLAKLAAPEQTKLVLVTYDPSAFTSKENVPGAAASSEKEEKVLQQENGANNKETFEDFGVDFEKGLGIATSNDSHDSCIGSSIVGDTSSGFRASTFLCTPDTSGSSFVHSTDTSANSDYIATGSESSPHSSFSPLASPPEFSVSHNPHSSCLPGKKEVEKNPSDATGDTQLPSKVATDGSGEKERKAPSKTKDYIHATNALFAVVDRTPSNGE